jgi:hypothetical protein
MKKYVFSSVTVLMFAVVFNLSLSAGAQTAAVKDIPADGDTTITVSKGKNSQNEYQITEGTGDIQGEPEVLTRSARLSWKKACSDWKQELKELNKDNQVLAMSCSTPKCTKNQSLEYLCESTGTYKVKTKVK